MSGIRPPDNSPGRVRQTETRPDRSGAPGAPRQVEEEAARFVRLVRSGRPPGEKDAEDRATGRRDRNADVGPASEHRDEGVPDSLPGSVRQTEIRPDRPGAPEAWQQVEEEAARFVRLGRSGRPAGEKDAGDRAPGRGERDADVGPASEHRVEGVRRVDERGRHRGDDFGQGDARDEHQSDAPPPGFRGDAILAGLGSAGTPPARDNEVRGRELPELVQGIVTRVLVGNRDSIPELRVTLGGNLFDRTELQISRRDGGIEVRISGGSAAAADFLARSGGELASQLANRLETRVVVQIAPPSTAQQTGGQDDRQDQRSRGLDALLTYAAG
jgi:hypothetical protein